MSSFDYLKKVAQQKAGRKKNQQISEEFTFLSVRIAGEAMCLSAEAVREIIPKPLVMPMGHAKPWYKGLMKVQGEVFSVIDIGLFLSGKSRGSKISYAIALQSESGQHAFAVEEVNGLIKEKVIKKQGERFTGKLQTESGGELTFILVEDIISSPEYNNVSIFS